MIAHLIGFIGALLAIIAYFLLTDGKLSSHSPVYLGLNILGSTLILLSLFTHPNIASATINICWILISVVGLLRARKA